MNQSVQGSDGQNSLKGFLWEIANRSLLFLKLTFKIKLVNIFSPIFLHFCYLSTIIRYCTDVRAFKTSKMVPYVLILSLALVTESLKTLKLLFESFVHFPDVVTEVYWSTILYTFLDVDISSFIHLVPPKQKFWFYQFCDCCFFFTITVYNWYFYACWTKVSHTCRCVWHYWIRRNMSKCT